MLSYGHIHSTWNMITQTSHHYQSGVPMARKNSSWPTVFPRIAAVAEAVSTLGVAAVWLALPEGPPPTRFREIT